MGRDSGHAGTARLSCGRSRCLPADAGSTGRREARPRADRSRPVRPPGGLGRAVRCRAGPRRDRAPRRRPRRRGAAGQAGASERRTRGRERAGQARPILRVRPHPGSSSPVRSSAVARGLRRHPPRRGSPLLVGCLDGPDPPPPRAPGRTHRLRRRQPRPTSVTCTPHPGRAPGCYSSRMPSSSPGRWPSGSPPGPRCLPSLDAHDRFEDNDRLRLPIPL